MARISVGPSLPALTSIVRVAARHCHQAKPQSSRYSSKPPVYDSVVVGGGPAGVAVIGNLLEQLPPNQRQLWIDPHFRSGRLGAKYREVPSNTRVSLFLKFAEAVAPFRHILKETPEPNPAKALSSLAPEQGCQLSYAADLCFMLTSGVRQFYAEQVNLHQGRLISAELNRAEGTWNVTLEDGKTASTRRLVLCTGSNPISATLESLSRKPPSWSEGIEPRITPIHLDIALKPSELAATLTSADPLVIAVVGASHSAILALMNLHSLAASSHPHLRIKWFTRHKTLRYAKDMEGGWILYDNTGLKGQAAEWARRNLEEETFYSSPVRRHLTKLWTPIGDNKDSAVYSSELPGCTHIIQAIGYKPNQLPGLFIRRDEEELPTILEIEHDSITGRFFGRSKDQSALSRSTQDKSDHIPRLFGAGIAFPEKVVDPANNQEHAVGLWKFMKFLKVAVSGWVKQPQ